MAEASPPKALILLKRYDLQTFTADLIAGITVGLVALPLAMAFAISSGVSPQYVEAGRVHLLQDKRIPDYVSVFRKQPAALMHQAEFHQHVGAENVCPNIKAALERATLIHDSLRREVRLTATHPVSRPT